MAALAADRAIPSRDGRLFEFTPAAGQVIFRGALVGLNATGELVRGTVSTTFKALGVAEWSTLDAGYVGRIRGRRGTFRFANSAAADLIAAADIGGNCYVVDDQTVAKTDGSSTRSIAGKIRDVDAQGVWVEFT